MELGNFIKDENGKIAGTVTTLISSFDIEYRMVEKVGNGPDYRVYRAGTDLEVGMAHMKYGERSGKYYLNTLIDTPEFTEGVWLALVQEDEIHFIMKWSRARKQPTTSDANTNTSAQATDNR